MHFQHNRAGRMTLLFSAACGCLIVRIVPLLQSPRIARPRQRIAADKQVLMAACREYSARRAEIGELGKFFAWLALRQQRRFHVPGTLFRDHHYLSIAYAAHCKR